jgi:Ca2+-binding EF-hand superfamily protein
MPDKVALAAELTFDEMLRARQVWLLHTDEYITTPFELRTILSELGQYPQDAELNFCVDAFGNKMAFNNFTTYLGFLKKRFQKPEPQDVDTLRAFVALGGGADRRGDINAENLRNACRHFDLTIDIDAMIKEVDDDMSGKLEFSEFKSMWGGPDGGAAAAAEAKKADKSGSFSMEVDEFLLSGTLRRGSVRIPGGVVVSPPPPPEDDDAPEEDQIELLKLHLFPQEVRKTTAEGSRKSNAAKRTSMLANSRFGGAPNAIPLRDSANNNSTANAAANAAAGRHEPSNNNGLDGSDSDDDGGAPQQTHYKGHYKPPSPVILSLRNSKPPTKLRSSARGGSITPRRGGHGSSSARSTTTPRASPRR